MTGRRQWAERVVFSLPWLVVSWLEDCAVKKSRSHEVTKSVNNRIAWRREERDINVTNRSFINPEALIGLSGKLTGGFSEIGVDPEGRTGSRTISSRNWLCTII